MVQTPPRVGKSEIVSRRFPAFYLGRYPNRQFISASYGADFSAGFGRDVRNLIASKEYHALFRGVSLAPDSKAKNLWHTNKDGVYLATGVGAAATGYGAHVLSIDDPTKDRQEAESATVRESVWDWYTSVAYTRLMPGGAIVLVMTRWHVDDLCGRLLEAEEAGGDRWEKLIFPAINEDGTALWEEAYPREVLGQIRSVIGERDWASLYEQRPYPTQGNIFQVHQILTRPDWPTGGTWCRGWDLAATSEVGGRDPSWTRGVLLHRSDDELPRYTVCDVAGVRGTPDQVENLIKNTARVDGHEVIVSLPQDPGQAAKMQVLSFTRMLEGYVVKTSPETGDKATRAAPVASQCNAGNLMIVEAPWNKEFLSEIAAHPNGSHNDQGDALARAFNELALGPSEFSIDPDVLQGLRMGTLVPRLRRKGIRV